MQLPHLWGALRGFIEYLQAVSSRKRDALTADSTGFFTMGNILFLKNIPLFSGLGEEELKEFLNILSEKSYKKGEIVFHQGDPGNMLFIIKNGAVKISLQDKTGKEDILKVMYRGDFFGEMSLLDGEYRSATITAMEKTTALLISRKDVIRLIRKMPSIALHMLAVMSRRLRRTDEKIASLRFADAYGKIAKVILDLLSEKGRVLKGNKVIDLNISRQELGDLAGLSRETATKILNEFQRSGCIKIENRKIVILNEGMLRREAL